MRSAFLGVLFFCFATAVAVHAEWVKLEKVKYEDNPSNDGDSFHVKHEGKEYYFRLYFVDSPETRTEIEDRIKEQATSFQVSPKQIPHFGKEAKRFTKDKLNKPFTVWTEWMDAKGDSKMDRHFAFVQTADGKDLGQELVGNGLARVYGAQADHPEGPDRSGQWTALDSRLRDAKTRQLGCWNKSQK